ncbi:hypothetical protein H0H93_009855 [Arthromyces matolae]|nr:hypothetical protein H0H93_009855 [Arthromyces matolae]
MRSRSSNNQYSNATGGHNVEGAVKDEDTFVLGDDDDDDDSGSEDAKPASSLSNQNPTISRATLPDNNSQGGELEPPSGASDNSPLKYYIASSDTLQGIVLRFGLDGHEVCRLNKLPPSTLRTTPHLLHTRRYLILPPSARKSGIPLNNESSEQAAVREAKWGKERAERQLQTVMKEADWRVAKAYVALADDPNALMEEQEVWERKRKEYGGNIGVGPSKLGERAIQNYLDDDEWEASQPKTRSNKGCF